MTLPRTLKGIDLIDCAQANAKFGLSTAALQCGYENDLLAFQKELQKAGSELGLHIDSLNDLILEIKKIDRGRDFSPDTLGQI